MRPFASPAPPARRPGGLDQADGTIAFSAAITLSQVSAGSLATSTAASARRAYDACRALLSDSKTTPASAGSGR